MKRVIISLLILSVMLACSSCNKQTTSNVSDTMNLEVTEEPFESMEIRPAFADYTVYSDEKEIFNSVEAVFVAMPLETFTDGEARYYNLDGKQINKDSSEKIGSVYTVRKFKVIEVIKGDIIDDTIYIAERGSVGIDEQGEQVLKGITSPITKKNAKYLYYANRDENKDFYIAVMDNGKISIDGLDANMRKSTDEKRLNEVKTRFSQQFKKYDRSEELSTK